MKMALILILFLAQSAQATLFQECETQYATRSNLIAAADCFIQTSGHSLDGYQRAFMVLASIVTENLDHHEDKEAIRKALLVLEGAPSLVRNTGEFAYWKAVFISFKVQQQDRNSLIPRHTMSSISEIKSLLRLAVAKSPTVHAYGPQRVLGIINTEMPVIVGGDRSYAEEMLQVSYQKGQALSANHLAYAKILMVRGKKEMGKTILKSFLSVPDQKLNLFENEPLMFPRLEVARDRAEAQKLLEEMGE